MTEKAILKLGDKEYEFPIVVGTEEERGIDICKLRSLTGHITLDPAYVNTGSCTSDITFIDGERGILRYRGIPLEQFANGPNFIEIAWLLIFGRLPSAEEYKDFADELTYQANIDEGMKHHYSSFPRKAPPMAILGSMVNALSCFHPEFLDLDDEEKFYAAAARLISKIRTLAAFAYRHANGLPYLYPNPNLKYVPNFLHMMFSMPYHHYECDEIIRDALNLIFILHADHEQNCSTSTVRMVGSSQANLFASCSAGINALWGPLHGGANVAVMQMLEQIYKGNLSVEQYVKLAKDKDSNVRLMGFGHRVYKNFDPRAKMLGEIAERLLPKIGKPDPLLDIARQLEEHALRDDYFVERKLYPNVDFYSGIILRAIGIPNNMFTVIFAMGRLPGWIAHWWEQKHMEGAQICRPRQIYTGNGMTDYVPMPGRKYPRRDRLANQ